MNSFIHYAKKSYWVIIAFVFQLGSSPTLFAQKEIGSEKNGQAAGDFFGRSVAISEDGSVIAVGAHAHDGNGTRAGRVRVYDKIGSNWSLRSSIDGDHAENRSGFSTALSADGAILAIGAYASHNGGERGEVKVFEWDGSSWSQLGSDIDGDANGDRFGWKVSLSEDGTRLAISGTRNDDGGTQAGHVKVFDWDGSSWNQVGNNIDGDAANDEFGYSLVISGDGSRLAAGSIKHASDDGHAKVFELIGGAWTQLGGDFDGGTNDSRGFQVSLNYYGNRVAIGAPENDDSFGGAGQVTIYDWDGSSWSQVGSEINGEGSGDKSGRSLQLSSDGERLAIGAPYNDGNGNSSGQFRIYDWSNDDGVWEQVGVDIDGASSSAYLAASLAMSHDGTTLITGSPLENDNGTNAGQARLWDISAIQLGSDVDGDANNDKLGLGSTLSGNGKRMALGSKAGKSGKGYSKAYNFSGGSWVQMGSDFDGDAVGDSSGANVAMNYSGDRFCIGAIGAGSNKGRVRVWSWDGSSWNKMGSDIDGEAVGDKFGSAVAMDSVGSRIIVGAINNDGSGADAGSARIYDWDGSSWNQVGSDLDGESAGDKYGRRVSLNAKGDYCAVGSEDNSGNGSKAGHVRLFKYNGSVWNQLGSDIDGEAADDRCGGSISLNASGKRCAIGARRNSGSGHSQSGHVRIFEWSGASWNQMGSDLDGEEASGKKGRSVCLNRKGNRLVSGSPGRHSNQGQADVYDWNGSSWKRKISISPASSKFGFRARFGRRGKRVVVGAPTGGSGNKGRSKCYQIPPTGPSGGSGGSGGGGGGGDTEDPVANTQNINAYLDGSGNVSVSANDVDDNSTDNVGITSYSLDNEDFDCSDLGANVVILTVEDAAGNSDDETATVTVIDTIAPARTLNNFTLVLDGSGNGTLLSANVTSGVSDNCASTPTISLGQTAFDCDDIASSPITVTVTVSDGNGNSRGGTVQVTVQDNAAPYVTRNDKTIYLDASGNASISVGDVTSGISDNCTSSPSVALGQTAFDCDDLGANTVSVNVTDGHSNANNGSVTVTVEDTVAPIRTLNNATVYLDGSGNASIASGDVSSSVSDNCDATPAIALSNTTFNCDSLGNRNVRVTISDDEGNSRSGLVQVTVEDTVAPTRTLNNYTLVLDATGNGTLQGTNATSGVADNCASTPTISLGQTAFDCDDIASSPITVTVTVSDGNGNSRGGTVQVTVQDNTAPSVTRNDKTIYLDASGNASISAGDVTSNVSDNCTSSPSVALGQTAFDCDDLGANTVSANVTDGNSNTNSGSVTVTVEDTLAPLRTLNNVTVYLDGSGNASIGSGDVSSAVSDNCDATPTIDLSNISFNCDSLGSRNVRVTVTDDEGNSRSGLVQVTVVDSMAPTFTANNHTLYLDASGNATLTTGNVTSSVNDVCDVSPIISLSNTSFDCDSTGAQNVRVTVTDASGNNRSALVQVTVIDTIAPIGTLNNYTVYLDAVGSGSISSSNVISGISDACDASVTVDLSNSSFDCDSVGNQDVRVTVTDVHGNSRSGLVQITVEDTIAPTHTLSNTTVYLDANGNGTLGASAVSSSVADACDSSPIISLSNSSFDCDSVGNQSVRVTTTDLNGNSRSGLVTITISDTIAPTFDTTHATLVLSTVSGQVTLTTGDVTTNMFDACDIDPNIVLSKTLFDCGDIGANTVTVTVTDQYGNNRSADVPVTIEHHPVVDANFEIVRDTACVVTVYNTSTQYNHLTWNWGDGSQTHTRAVDTIQHTYTDIDDFIITLTAFDTCDYTSIHTDTVRIWPYVHNNTRDTSCSNEPYSVIDADCISIALIEWRKNGTVVNDERPDQKGQGTVCAGGNDGGARNTQFRSNAGIALNPANGNVLVVDKFNHRVMSWSCGGANGIRIAGSVSPSGNPHPGSRNNQLRYPQDVWADAAGNVYIADMGNDRIMKYAPGATSGVRVAGGGTGAGSLKSPTGVVVASNGDIYVADQGNHRIVRYTSTDTAVVAGVSGVSGNGLTHLNKPWDIIIDGTDMLIAEYGNHRVLRWPIGASSGTVIAGGNGYGRSDRHLAGPKAISINRYDELFIADYHNDRIMKWEAGASEGVKMAGNNGTGNSLDQVLHPEGVIADNMGRMWISDTRNHRVLKWNVDPVALTDSTLSTGNYTVTLELEDGRNVTVDSTIYFLQDTYTLAGFTFTTTGLDLDVTNTSDDDTTWTWSWGNGDSAFVKHPGTYTYSQPGTYEVCLTVSDTCSNADTICQMVTVTAPNSTLSAGLQANACDEATLTVSGPSSANVLRVEYYKDGTLMTQGATGIDTIGTTVAGGNGGGSALNQFKNARRVYVDQLGNVFVTEKDNNRVTMWAPGATAGIVVAGGSRGSGAEQLSWPMGITMDANGDLIIADTYNNRVQKVTIGSLSAITIAGGSSGNGIGQLNRPSSVAVDGSGNLYISDENNHRIVRYSSTDTVVVAGTGSAGSDLNQLNKPSDIKIAGSYLYVADRENHRVMRWPLTAIGGANGVVVAGGNGYGSGADELKHPESIGVDGSGAVYISDYGNNRLQIWLPGDSVGSTEVGGAAVGRGNAAYQLHNPEGLFIAADGSMYCVDRGNNRVQKYAAQGSASQFNRTTDGTGIYHAVVFYTDGSSQTTNTVNVTVATADAGAWTHTTNGLDLTITSASPVGTNFTWYFGDGNSSTAGTPVHTYATDSTYNVCLVATDDCGNTDSTCVDVTVAAPPVPSIAGDPAENNANDRENIGFNGNDVTAPIVWDVYPNPTDGLVNLHASQEGATVELMDIRGQVIATWRMNGMDMEIDLSDKAQGTYMIRMILDSDIHMERIILDRR